MGLMYFYVPVISWSLLVRIPSLCHAWPHCNVLLRQSIMPDIKLDICTLRIVLDLVLKIVHLYSNYTPTVALLTTGVLIFFPHSDIISKLESG